MNRKAREGVQRVKGEIHKKTGIISIRFRQKMRIKVNTLDYATEEVLFMVCEDEKWQPIAFLSKSLNETKRNYKFHDKEMLAVIRGLKNQKYLLKDAKFKFEIWTDHKNLEYFIKAQKLNRRQAHWASYLSRFNFILKHVPETKIEKTNKLSRRLDWKIDIEKDNENQIFIKDHWLCNLSKVVIEGPEVDILEKIKLARSKDKEVVRIVEEMKKTSVKVLRGMEQQIERDMVLKKRKVYIPKNKTLRVEIIQLHHNIPVVEHGGKQKIIKLVTRNYQWPGVTRDVEKYVEECDMYQRMKNRTEVPAEKLKLSEVPEKS